MCERWHCPSCLLSVMQKGKRPRTQQLQMQRISWWWLLFSLKKLKITVHLNDKSQTEFLDQRISFFYTAFYPIRSEFYLTITHRATKKFAWIAESAQLSVGLALPGRCKFWFYMQNVNQNDFLSWICFFWFVIQFFHLWNFVVHILTGNNMCHFTVLHAMFIIW